MQNWGGKKNICKSIFYLKNTNACIVFSDSFCFLSVTVQQSPFVIVWRTMFSFHFFATWTGWVRDFGNYTFKLVLYQKIHSLFRKYYVTKTRLMQPYEFSFILLFNESLRNLVDTYTSHGRELLFLIISSTFDHVGATARDSRDDWKMQKVLTANALIWTSNFTCGRVMRAVSAVAVKKFVQVDELLLGYTSSRIRT